MFHVKKFGLWLALIGVTLGMLLPAVVSAQATTTRPPLSLTTSPIPLSVITTPGKTVTADLRVKNNATNPEQLKIELLKFGANGESGSPQLHEREAKDTYFEWVSFSEQTFTAEPNVWKTIKMTIKTPPEAAFGYYLAVLFSRAAPDKPTGGASAVEGGVASLVLLDVEAPGASREAKVLNLTADHKVYEFLPANLNIKLRNAGNVHVAPVGSIFIKKGGTQVAVLDFNTQHGNILPGSNRVFSTSWSDGFPYYEVKTVGSKTTKSLKWDFSKIQKFRFGHYTATLVAVYDNGQRDIPIEATVGFWVIPWRILGVLLLIFLFVGAGIWMMLRGIWKKVPKRTSGGGKDDSSGNTDHDVDAEAENESVAKPVVHKISIAETAPELDDTAVEPDTDTAKPVAKKSVAKKSRKKKSPSSAPALPKSAPELKD